MVVAVVCFAKDGEGDSGGNSMMVEEERGGC